MRKLIVSNLVSGTTIRHEIPRPLTNVSVERRNFRYLLILNHIIDYIL